MQGSQTVHAFIKQQIGIIFRMMTALAASPFFQCAPSNSLPFETQYRAVSEQQAVVIDSIQHDTVKGTSVKLIMSHMINLVVASATDILQAGSSIALTTWQLSSRLRYGQATSLEEQAQPFFADWQQLILNISKEKQATAKYASFSRSTQPAANPGQAGQQPFKQASRSAYGNNQNRARGNDRGDCHLWDGHTCHRRLPAGQNCHFTHQPGVCHPKWASRGAMSHYPPLPQLPAPPM